MGSAPKLRAMVVRHGSQDAASSQHAEVHLADRLVNGDLGEHAGIPSTEQVASVADQAAKMNMSKLGSRCVAHGSRTARSPFAGAYLCGITFRHGSGPLPQLGPQDTYTARGASNTCLKALSSRALPVCAARNFTETNSFTRRWRAPCLTREDIIILL
jgi:hypothetical protein